MRESDPLYEMLSQMGDLLNTMKESAKQPFVEKLPEGLQARLDNVELMALALRQVADEEVRNKGLKEEDIASRLFKERAILPKKEQRIIEHTISLTRDTLGMKYALMAAELKAAGTPLTKPFDAQKAKNEQVNKRKSKFKKMHGDAKWKKL